MYVFKHTLKGHTDAKAKFEAKHLYTASVVISTMCLQVAVLPMEVYNDVQHMACPALDAPHLAAEAQADAQVCLRKLISNLAAEVPTASHCAAVNAAALVVLLLGSTMLSSALLGSRHCCLVSNGFLHQARYQQC